MRPVRSWRLLNSNSNFQSPREKPYKINFLTISQMLKQRSNFKSTCRISLGMYLVCDSEPGSPLGSVSNYVTMWVPSQTTTFFIAICNIYIESKIMKCGWRIRSPYLMNHHHLTRKRPGNCRSDSYRSLEKLRFIEQERYGLKYLLARSLELSRTARDMVGVGWKVTKKLVDSWAHAPHCRRIFRCLGSGPPASRFWHLLVLLVHCVYDSDGWKVENREVVVGEEKEEKERKREKEKT